MIWEFEDVRTKCIVNVNEKDCIYFMYFIVSF